MKIVTLTLNPAFDIHCKATAFLPYHENIVEVMSREAGGKGINVSRALASAYRKSKAVVLAAKENAEEFADMLCCGLVDPIFVYSPGRIRENITIHENGKEETRISFGGIKVDKSILNDVVSAIGDVDSQTVITLTGSMPIALEARDVLEILADAKKKGAKIVIDSRSVSLSEILAFKPWLIKPNRDEIEKYAKCKIETPLDAIRIAEEICNNGVENVMISLGHEGAVLCCGGKNYYARVPAVTVSSTIGAGDSAIAGFIDAYCENATVDKCLRRAVSFGTAACMRAGTQPPVLEDIKRIECDIEVERV